MCELAGINKLNYIIFWCLLTKDVSKENLSTYMHVSILSLQPCPSISWQGPFQNALPFVSHFDLQLKPSAASLKTPPKINGCSNRHSSWWVHVNPLFLQSCLTLLWPALNSVVSDTLRATCTTGRKAGE